MNLGTKSNSLLTLVTKRYFTKSTRPWQDRLRPTLNRHKSKRLELAFQVDGRPGFYKQALPTVDPLVKKNEHKLLPLHKAKPPYKGYSKEEIDRLEGYGTLYDPNFNPHLYDEKHRVDPNEEPFNAIYADKNTPANEEQYTGVRNITSPELWKHVENLARVTVNPPVRLRKPDEPIEPTPSGWYPPPEQAPDLPYFIPRTRTYMLPVYYYLHSDPSECKTIIKQITGDLWKLEEDVRVYLESMLGQRVLTSVHETDARIYFRGRHLHQVVDFLHQKGF